MNDGTYVAASLDDDSIEVLIQLQNILSPYCGDTEVPVKPSEFHLTICYSPIWIPYPETKEIDPFTITCSRLVNIGNALAIAVNSPELSKEYKLCKMLGASSKWGGYCPHVSLFYKNQIDAYKIKNIVLPDALTVVKYYSDELKDD